MAQITETEKAYLAGLVDGEGCITILKGRQGGKKRHLIHHRLAIIISQTNQSYLDYWQKKTGLGKVYACRTANKQSNWAQAYQWHLSSREAAVLLKLIRPYLSLKQDQATIALDFAATMYEEGLGPRGSASLYRRRDEAYEALKALHGRHGDKAISGIDEFEPTEPPPGLQLEMWE